MNEVTIIPPRTDHAIDLHGVADRIRARIADATENIIAIGQDLITAREMIPHGAFLPWLEEQFHWSRSTAYNFIAAAELAKRFPTVGNLQAKTIYLLAAKTTPQAIVTEVVADIDAGKPIKHGEIAARVRDERQAAWLSRRKQRRSEAMANRDKSALREAAREAKAAKEQLAWERKRDASEAKIIALLEGKGVDVAAVLAIEDDLKISGIIRQAFETMAEATVPL